ncbi:MAG: AAA family ATPase [Chthonomonadales bacterium]|nr:AAA family ATPase [Chthonomonadales bacterium]
MTNCLYEIKNTDPVGWRRVIERAALGLGDDLREISFPSPSRGLVETQVWFGRLPEPLPLGSLSDGQIAYLGFVALMEIGRRHSLIVMDEPEQHLHPALLARVALMFEQLGADVPVIVATHSDRFLDALTRPEDSVVLCELDASRATRLRRPDSDALARWLEDYRGIGELRAEGYEPHVFAASHADADTPAC